ncbi:MAG: AraC family transcriptional regulator [Lachnospiraceae bacterium]
MREDLLRTLTSYTLDRLTDEQLNRYTHYKELLTDEVFENNNDIFINLHLMEANMKAQLHGHDFFELNFILKGTCIQTLDTGDNILLKEGSLCILNPNAKHSLFVESNENIILNILVKKSLFNSTFWSLIEQHEHIGSFFLNYFMSRNNSSSNYLIFDSKLSANLINTVEQICEEYLNRKLYYKVTLRCLLVVFFTEIIRSSNIQINNNKFTNKISVQIAALFNYLSINYATATLASTAEYFHYHPNYLSAFIKKHTGKNFKTILEDIKLSQANYYLLHTTMSIQDISERLGFSQQCNFYNFIKKAYNTTPAKFRQNF